MSFRPSNKINHAFYLALSPVLGGSFSSRQYGDLSCILYHVILSKTTVLIRVNQCLNLYLYLKKQSQFFPVFSPKTAICRNQSQFKANLNPIQTQFLSAEALAKADFGFRVLYTEY